MPKHFWNFDKKRRTFRKFQKKKIYIYILHFVIYIYIYILHNSYFDNFLFFCKIWILGFFVLRQSARRHIHIIPYYLSEQRHVLFEHPEHVVRTPQRYCPNTKNILFEHLPGAKSWRSARRLFWWFKQPVLGVPTTLSGCSNNMFWVLRHGHDCFVTIKQ